MNKVPARVGRGALSALVFLSPVSLSLSLSLCRSPPLCHLSYVLSLPSFPSFLRLLFLYIRKGSNPIAAALSISTQRAHWGFLLLLRPPPLPIPSPPPAVTHKPMFLFTHSLMISSSHPRSLFFNEYDQKLLAHYELASNVENACRIKLFPNHTCTTTYGQTVDPQNAHEGRGHPWPYS